MSKSTVARRADIQAALKRFKPRESISLEDLALLWGVTKARFINIRAQISDYPEPIGKQGNALLYNAKPALEALLRHETRNDAQTSAKSAKVARILGASQHQEGAIDDALPPSEMLALARASAEVDKRRREQGTLVLFAQVQQVAAEVFGHISGTLGKLSDSVDPNGKLPGATRTLLDGLGKDLLLRMYGELGDMLTDHVDGDTSGAKKARGRPARARRPRIRKKPA